MDTVLILICFSTIATLIIYPIYLFIRNKPWPYLVLLPIPALLIYFIGNDMHTKGSRMKEEELQKLMDRGEEIIVFQDVNGSFMSLAGAFMLPFSILVFLISFLFAVVYIIKKLKKK